MMKCWGKSNDGDCENTASWVVDYDNILILMCGRHAYLNANKGWKMRRL